MRRVSLQTPEQFRSLAATLLAQRKPAADEPAFAILEDVVHCEVPEIEQSRECDDYADVLRDLRLFHARITEAVEEAVETLTGDIAAAVLGRELLLAPADVEAIVDRALQRFACEQPLRVRVHPSDAGMTCALPVLSDARLRPGDAVIELRGGSVDASLGVRLAAVLRELQV